MPRGRPRKAIIEPIAQQTQKTITRAPIVPIIETITDGFIDIIEPSKEPVEDTQESDTMAEKGTTAQQMLTNVEFELDRLTSEAFALTAIIDEKEGLRSRLVFQCQKSEAAHREAHDTFNRLDQQITLQRQRTRLAKGTSAESEMQKELARLEEEYADANTILDISQKSLTEAKRALTESDSLVAECEEHKSQMEALNSLYRTTEQIYSEAKAARGLEIAQHIKDEIQAAREYQHQVLEDSAQRVQLAIDRINHELGDTWPELAQEVAVQFSEKVMEDSEESQGRVEAIEEIREAPPVDSVSSDPTIRLMEAWLRFVDCVRQDGQAAHKNRLRGNGLPLFSIIALSEGRLHHFANPGIWQQIRRRDENGRDFYHWSTPEFSSIEILLDKERERDIGWQYQRRDF